jgi:hypothetical protein
MLMSQLSRNLDGEEPNIAYMWPRYIVRPDDGNDHLELKDLQIALTPDDYGPF